MGQNNLENLRVLLAGITPKVRIGRVNKVCDSIIEVTGLENHAALGSRLQLARSGAPPLEGEVIKMNSQSISMLCEDDIHGVRLGHPVRLLPPLRFCPDDSWIGRIIDPMGRPLDGKPLLPGPKEFPIDAAPERAIERRALGKPMSTGLCVFNTALPLVQGQRIGLFAGSGVGKSRLIAKLVQSLEADLIVLALIGERGRELRDFVKTTLGPENMKRCVVIAATSDMAALVRRRSAQSAMSVAEYFRDQGKNVVYFADSITRFAEAHREVALSVGELPTLRGYPASTAHKIMSLCERAGPGTGKSGDITGIFSVLVAGSDMDEPIADILRGVLDGHVVLDRKIAERGRFPAIDLLRSVSRSLPEAATETQNQALLILRRLLGAYQNSETMIQAGLYVAGQDSDLDDAVKIWKDLDSFIGQCEPGTVTDSYHKLFKLLRPTQLYKSSMSAKA